jgi:hypothetical protein
VIDFKDPAERTPSAVMAASLLVLLATLLYMIFVPAPSAAGTAAGRERAERKLQTEITQARVRGEQMQADAARRLYQGDEQDVTARVLALLTARAEHEKVQIAAFRPQKNQPISGLIELPFSVQVVGPYPVLLTFLSSLEGPDSKIVVRSLQVADSGTGSSNVSATVGISVYCVDQTPPPAVPSPTPRAVTGGAHG